VVNKNVLTELGMVYLRKGRFHTNLTFNVDRDGFQRFRLPGDQITLVTGHSCRTCGSRRS
jgi:hypothetical protein